MQGEAADWAAQYASQIARSKAPGTTVAFPFEGSWGEFEVELKTRFGSIDEEAD
jgi:hypothetical protein